MPSRIMLIGERPGREENSRHRPFVGQSGQELNDTYLRLAGLDREDVYVTNAVKCFADGNRKPTPKETESCSRHHLSRELIGVDPDYLILLGSTACSLLEDGIDLDMRHGIPQHGSIFGWNGTYIPMYHPAAGLHDTSKMIPLLEDFERLGKFLTQEGSAPSYYLTLPNYSLIERPIQLLDYLSLNSDSNSDSTPAVAIDTERHGSTSFSWQISHSTHTGRMVQCARSGAEECAKLFTCWLRDTDAQVLLHNAPQDLDWLERMGVQVSPNRLRDTMQEAYHLGNLPQGLKSLAYRLLNETMRTYEDIVVPYSRNAISLWLAEAASYAAQHLQYIEHKQLKTKLKTITKPSLLQRGFNRIFNHTTIIATTYNPWKALEELFNNPKLTPAEKTFVECTRGDTIASQVISRLTDMPGPVPIIGIENVPEEEVVRYGCADADMTLQVAMELDEIRTRLIEGDWDVPQEDWDR